MKYELHIGGYWAQELSHLIKKFGGKKESMESYNESACKGKMLTLSLPSIHRNTATEQLHHKNSQWMLATTRFPVKNSLKIVRWHLSDGCTQLCVLQNCRLCLMSKRKQTVIALELDLFVKNIAPKSKTNEINYPAFQQQHLYICLLRILEVHRGKCLYSLQPYRQIAHSWKWAIKRNMRKKKPSKNVV